MKFTTALCLAAAAATAHGYGHHKHHRKEYTTPAAGEGQYSDTVLNVHVVPHTHDDVGWLKTVDQYFYGSNNTIQHAAVQYILDSAIPELMKNPNRMFTYVEIAFFSRWYYEQTEEMQDNVKKLVKNGQLSFVNGGWCMHDEAATHYIAMIDQTTLGHAFLKEELEFVPKVGWQIDPFGHSSTQASTLSWMAAFDALFFGRIDYQDRELRLESQECEGVWRASPSLGDDAQVFWGLTGSYGGNYGPPTGFNFDIKANNPKPVMDDTWLHDYNVPERVEGFVNASITQGAQTKGNHIMLTMGSDFQYEAAAEWYNNLDKLINYVNQDGRVNAFYSTPDLYIQAKNTEPIDWSVKEDDFFPYSDCEHCYWTGYFTSRPGLKRMERVMSGYLQAARQVEALAGVGAAAGVSPQPLFLLEAASAVAQHHDAVSGTSKQHVAFDYAQRLSEGYNQAAPEVFNVGIAKLAGLGPDATLVHCPNLNISVCDATSGESFSVVAYNSLAYARSAVLTIPVIVDTVVVTDATGEPVSATVVPSNSDADGALPYSLMFATGDVPPLSTAPYAVTVTSADSVGAAQAPTAEAVSGSGSLEVTNGKVTLTFDKSTGRLSGMAYKCVNGDQGEDLAIKLDQGYYYYTSFNGSVDLAEWDLSDCDPETGADCPEGYPKAVLHHHKARSLMDSVEVHSKVGPLHRDLGTSSDDQNSGAYIFRPSTPDQTPIPVGDTNPTLTVSKSDLVTEVHQVWSSWVSQTFRLYAGHDHAEVEWSVGPVPIDDDLGKEVITKFSSSIASAGTVYTDSNGREFLERKLDYRPTWDLVQYEEVAGNYYPVNMGLFIKDENVQLSILNDRSQGGASLEDGSMELMLHRRLLYDDSRGVGEPVNETTFITSYADDCPACREGTPLAVKGTLLLQLHAPDKAMKHIRSTAQRIYSPIEPVFGEAEAVKAATPVSRRTSTSTTSPSTASSNSKEALLPHNVKLLTFQAVSTDEVLIRLEHVFAIDEDATLSQPALVNVTALMSEMGFTTLGATELTLTGNQAKKSQHYLPWSTTDTKAKKAKDLNEKKAAKVLEENEGVITLNPMEIRTALVKVARH